MLTIEFGGWFQCRMATDPDPTDDPRGTSGTAFALITEPDFDRVIRFHNPVALRTFAPNKVGVVVTNISKENKSMPNHALLGAQVELLNQAMFEEQNGVIADSGAAVIDPFDLQISQGSDLLVRREAVWDVNNPTLSLYQTAPTLLTGRQPVAIQIKNKEVVAASGITDPVIYLNQRLKDLKQALNQPDLDPLEKAGIEQRIYHLEIDDWRRERAILLLNGRACYKFDLNGPASTIIDSTNKLEKIDTTSPWPLEFWMGAWDNDLLCGYVKGSLTLPWQSNS